MFQYSNIYQFEEKTISVGSELYNWNFAIILYVTMLYDKNTYNDNHLDNIFLLTKLIKCLSSDNLLKVFGMIFRNVTRYNYKIGDKNRVRLRLNINRVLVLSACRILLCKCSLVIWDAETFHCISVSNDNFKRWIKLLTFVYTFKVLVPI